MPFEDFCLSKQHSRASLLPALRFLLSEEATKCILFLNATKADEQQHLLPESSFNQKSAESKTNCKTILSRSNRHYSCRYCTGDYSDKKELQRENGRGKKTNLIKPLNRQQHQCCVISMSVCLLAVTGQGQHAHVHVWLESTCSNRHQGMW